MQLEWSEYLKGIMDFKSGQGMLWIFCLALFAVLWQRKLLKGSLLLIASLVLGFVVFCPLTAILLLKGYTPFYNWMDLQQLVPWPLLLAIFGVAVVELLGSNSRELAMGRKGRETVAVLAVAVLLMTGTNFHGFDVRPQADKHGVPMETAEVFDALQDLVGEQQVVLAARGDMLQYSRMYELAWRPLYGRDLWSGKSASYINSGYDVEYLYYDFLGRAELKDEAPVEFVSLVSQGHADCVIVPGYWRDTLGRIPGYELVDLTDAYMVIIKEDLV